MKSNTGSRVIFIVILVLVVIFATGFLVQYATSGTNLFQTLGFSLRDKCSGTLSLSVTETGNCLINAKVLTYDCLGKTYEIRKDSCTGNLKCEGTIEYDSFQSSCNWNILSGNYNYVLCVGKGQKDSKYVTC